MADTGAVIAVDQDRPGGTSYGTPGVARKDLWQNWTVRPRCATTQNASYLWELLDAPPQSAAELEGHDQPACSLLVDLPHSYMLRLTTNGGGPGNVQTLAIGVSRDSTGRLMNRGWVIPAVGEAPWHSAMRMMLEDILAHGFSAGGGSGASVTVTSDHEVTTSDTIIFVNSTQRSVEISIPADQAWTDRMIRIKDVGGAARTHPIIVTAPSQTIDGQPTRQICLDYGGLDLVRSANEWSIL